MAKIKVLVLRAAGTNCDAEACHAWELAGANPERLHLRRVAESPDLLDQYQILTIPGGFSYGDDISAGRIFAAQLERELSGALRSFVNAGKLILGICNGFQILVKARMLPQFTAGADNSRRALSLHAGSPGAHSTVAQAGAHAAATLPRTDATVRAPRTCTITYNDPPGFQDRWVTLQAATATKCVFLEPGAVYEMPIAHGEGRVVFATTTDLDAAIRDGHAALRYCAPRRADTRAQGPYNPNGSTADIAGLCDETGRIFGLMPHPERFVDATQHPCWTARARVAAGDGLQLFQRAVAYFR